MPSEIINLTWKSGLTQAAKMVMLALAFSADSDDQCRITIGAIVGQTGYKERTVTIVLPWLAAEGLVHRLGRDCYRIDRDALQRPLRGPTTPSLAAPPAEKTATKPTKHYEPPYLSSAHPQTSRRTVTDSSTIARSTAAQWKPYSRPAPERP